MFKYVRFNKVEDAYTTHSFLELNHSCTVHRFDVDVVSIAFAEMTSFTTLLEYQDPVINATEITKDEFLSLVSETSQVIRIYDRANRQYKADMESVTLKYSQEERDTWPSQVAEAQAFLNNGTTGVMLSLLAQGDGVSVPEYAEFILAKAIDFSSFSAVKLAQKRAFIAKMKAEIGLL